MTALIISVILGIVTLFVLEETNIFNRLIFSLFVICFIYFCIRTVAHFSAESTFLNKEVQIELQKINGEMLITQGNEYVLKYKNTIRILPKYKIDILPSDSSYTTKVITTRIYHYEDINRWAIKNLENDTIIYMSKIYIYKKFE